MTHGLPAHIPEGTGLSMYVCFVAQEAGVAVEAFEPLSVWLTLHDPGLEPTLVTGIPALLEHFNQERRPDGSLHDIVQTPKGLAVRRPRPLERGYWVAAPDAPDEKAIMDSAKRLTKHDHVRPREAPVVEVDTFDQLEAALRGETAMEDHRA